MTKIYCLIHDKLKGDKAPPVESYEVENKEYFQLMNKKGYGVYCTINEFEATPEQMKEAGCFTKRNNKFISKINSIFADLDIAKAGDNQTREQKEGKKEKLLFDIYELLKPSKVIDTSNGVQVIFDLSDSNTSPEYIARYTQTINAIIEWSKTKGAAGDAVKDLARVLRIGGYNHMKEEPFLITEKYIEPVKYKLEEIENVFKSFIKKEEKKHAEVDYTKLDRVGRAIKMIDFRELIIRAFASIGRAVSFDNSGHLLDPMGQTTGTFQGRNGDRRYLASSSHEPYEGNEITAVADIKGINSKEARAWIVEEYALNDNKLKIKEQVKELEKPIEQKKVEKYYSWGTKVLTESFAPIKRGTHALIAGASGVGKTTFCVNLALDNVKLGHKVLYLSLEMSGEEILEYLCRKAAGITIPEEIYHTIPPHKTELYQKRYNYIKSINNFVLKGVVAGTDVTWGHLEEIMSGDWDLIIVDNFNLIQKEDRTSQFDHEAILSKKFLSFSQKNQVPVLVVHHFSKGGAKENAKTSYSLSGNSMIMNNSMRTVLLDRRRPDIDEELSAQDKARMSVRLDKGRGYDDGVTKIIYFQKGVFSDTFNEEIYAPHWQDKN